MGEQNIVRQQLKNVRRLAGKVLPKKRFQQHVFLVGVQKSGTTSLHSYLLEHPQIVGGDKKELHFFDREVNYVRGIESYRCQFPVLTRATHALDSSPSYFYRQSVPSRIHAFQPDAKIVVILREPIARAFSAFNMYVQIAGLGHYASHLRRANIDSQKFYLPIVEGEVKPTLDYFIKRELAIMAGQAQGEEPALIRRGIYAPQLSRYVNQFGRENILVLFSNDLKSDPEATTNRVLGFLGLEPLRGAEYPLLHVREHTAGSEGMDVIRNYASDLFAKDKQELLDCYGIQVPW